MNHAEADRAIASELKKGAELLDQNLLASQELMHLLKKFKMYRNSTKFLKTTFENYDSEVDSESEDAEDKRESAEIIDTNLTKQSGLSAEYSVDILSYCRKSDAAFTEVALSKSYLPKFLPTSLIFEKIHQAKFSHQGR